MRYTPFAGLTVLDPGDPVTTNGASFLNENPSVTDTWLRRIVTHRHNGAAPILAPHTLPTVTSLPTGGGIPANTRVYVGYTIVDSDGGETVISPVGSGVTAGGIGAASAAPTGSINYTAGTLTVNDYQYAYTLTDGAGGETPASFPLELVRAPGASAAEAVITGMAAILAANPSAVAWRMYKASGGDQYAFHQTGTGDTYVDDGTIPVVLGTEPPIGDTTNQTAKIHVVVPNDSYVAAGVAFNLYLSLTPQFFDPSFYAQYPVASAGATITVSHITLQPGSPPPVATSNRGASKIDAFTDISNLHWCPPVAASGALPSGTQGDVRLALNSGHLWAVLGVTATVPGDWTELTAGTGSFTIADDFSEVVPGVERLQVSASANGEINSLFITVGSLGAGVGVLSIQNLFSLQASAVAGFSEWFMSPGQYIGASGGVPGTLDLPSPAVGIVVGVYCMTADQVLIQTQVDDTIQGPGIPPGASAVLLGGVGSYMVFVPDVADNLWQLLGGNQDTYFMDLDYVNGWAAGGSGCSIRAVGNDAYLLGDVTPGTGGVVGFLPYGTTYAPKVHAAHGLAIQEGGVVVRATVGLDGSISVSDASLPVILSGVRWPLD